MVERLAWRALIPVFLCALLSALMFYRTQGVISLVPLLAAIALMTINRLRKVEAIVGVYIFVGLIFILDDTNYNPWGSVDTITKTLGYGLYQSFFSVTASELLAFSIAVWTFLNTNIETKKVWLRYGLIFGLVITFLYPILFWEAFFISNVFDDKASTLKFHLAQIRMHHILPLWFFIGFSNISNWKRFDTVMKIMAWTTVVKSIQGVFNYIFHIDVFGHPENEYLIEHYYSMFAAMTICYFIMKAISDKNKISTITAALVLPPVFASFALNDRRTAVLGSVLAIIMIIASKPLSWFLKHKTHFVVAATAFVLFTGATWNASGPLAVVSSTLKSLIIKPEGTIKLDYRDLENANILREVANNPYLGMGSGAEVENKFGMPDISHIYPKYLVLPHNIYLAYWAIGGPLNMAMFTSLFVFMVALSIKTQSSSYVYKNRSGAIALFFFVQWIAYTIADLGIIHQRNVIIGGLFLGALMRNYYQDQIRGDYG